MTSALTLRRFHDLAASGSTAQRSVSVRLAVEASAQRGRDRVASFVFSDHSVDSYGDTIDPAGWDLAAYLANPVCLYGHDPSKPENVIGRAQNVRVVGRRLLGDIIFADAAINPTAELVYQLLLGGYLNAVSVGFEPVEWKLASDPGRPGGVDFARQKLREVSVVAIPANSNALMQAKAAGLDVTAVTRGDDQRRQLARGLKRRLSSPGTSAHHEGRHHHPAAHTEMETSTMHPALLPRAAAAAKAARARRLAAEDGLYAFRTMGEQLQALARAEIAGTTDSRLVRAPIGANEGAPSAGGFLVQSNLADNALGMAYEDAIIAPLCTRPEYQVAWGTMAGGVNLPGIDETSRADGSRYGGVVAYWAAEADQVSGSRPRFKSIGFVGRKLIGVCTVTNELLADAALLDFYINRAFAAEFGFKLDAAVLRGTGGGVPLGLLNSTALIPVAKEVGQSAATVVAENVTNMWKRLPIPSRRRASWLVHEDVEALLPALNYPTPGVYQPAGADGFEFPRLMGAPVLAVEQASPLGTVGDIVLADLSHYLIIDGGIAPALSVHFGFDNDEATFRFVLHLDGKPEFTSPVSPYSGSTSRSPFVALANRS